MYLANKPNVFRKVLEQNIHHYTAKWNNRLLFICILSDLHMSNEDFKYSNLPNDSAGWNKGIGDK